MGTANNSPSAINLFEEMKNYTQPDVLCHTFDLLSNLHKLLPNHLVEVLHSYRSEDDKIKCKWVEGGGECLCFHAGVSLFFQLWASTSSHCPWRQFMRPMPHRGSIGLRSQNGLWICPWGEVIISFFLCSLSWAKVRYHSSLGITHPWKDGNEPCTNVHKLQIKM